MRRVDPAASGQLCEHPKPDRGGVDLEIPAQRADDREVGGPYVSVVGDRHGDVPPGQ
jgi:hypothetical protein